MHRVSTKSVIAQALIASGLVASAAMAQPTIDWYTIDGGGGTSTGAAGPVIYELSGTIGQPDAGILTGTTGGGQTIELSGGFWPVFGGPSGCSDVDFNNDGVFPDDADLADFLFVLGGGLCVTCDSVDFNGDSVFPDDQDIIDFLFVLGGGSC